MNHFVSKARQQFGMMGGPKSTWGGGTYLRFDGEGVKVSRGGAPIPSPLGTTLSTLGMSPLIYEFLTELYPIFSPRN